MPRDKKGSKKTDRKAFFAGAGEFNEEYSNASSDFTPTEGTYLCELKRFRFGDYTPKSGKKQGKPQKYFNPQFEILDGKSEGLSFSPFVSTAAMGIFKAFYAGLNGEVIDDFQAACETAETRVGNTYEVTVTQNGDFTNYSCVAANLDDPDTDDEDDADDDE